MSSFNAINGVPATANAFTLTKVLREEWKFDGFVVSDYTSVRELINHGVAGNDCNRQRRPRSRDAAGAAFGLAWTPCIGPILSAILLVASTQETIGEGVQLLASYSAGLGVPFIATSLAINQFLAASARIRKHYHTIEVVSGVLMVIVGVLIFTNKFTVIARWLTPYLPTY